MGLETALLRNHERLGKIALTGGFAFGFAVFVNVYVMIALDDLQSDFVNPHDATRRINRLIAWEIGAHACGCAFMLVGGHWVMVLANAPLVYYHYVGCARLWNSSVSYTHLTLPTKRIV